LSRPSGWAAGGRLLEGSCGDRRHEAQNDPQAQPFPVIAFLAQSRLCAGAGGGHSIVRPRTAHIIVCLLLAATLSLTIKLIYQVVRNRPSCSLSGQQHVEQDAWRKRLGRQYHPPSKSINECDVRRSLLAALATG